MCLVSWIYLHRRVSSSSSVRVGSGQSRQHNIFILGFIANLDFISNDLPITFVLVVVVVVVLVVFIGRWSLCTQCNSLVYRKTSCYSLSPTVARNMFKLHSTITPLLCLYVVLVAAFFSSLPPLVDGSSLGAKLRCAVKSLAAVDRSDPHFIDRPFIDGGKTFFGGYIRPYSGEVETVTSPILDSETGARTEIGRIAQMKKDELLPVLQAAKEAWNQGQGVWPQMTVDERIAAIENVVKALKQKRAQIIKVLMWEICKSQDDAAAEFDRTMLFIDSVIDAFRSLDGQEGNWQRISGILAKVRRTALGIILCLGPFNCESLLDCCFHLLLFQLILMFEPSFICSFVDRSIQRDIRDVNSGFVDGQHCHHEDPHHWWTGAHAHHGSLRCTLAPWSHELCVWIWS
jgi:hypothetical protein